MSSETAFRKEVRRLFRDQSGVSNLEYGVILSLIAVSSVGALEMLGISVKDSFNQTSSSIVSNNGSTNSTNGGGANASTDGSETITPDEPSVAAAAPMVPDAPPTEEPVTPDEPAMTKTIGN